MRARCADHAASRSSLRRNGVRPESLRSRPTSWIGKVRAVVVRIGRLQGPKAPHERFPDDAECCRVKDRPFSFNAAEADERVPERPDEAAVQRLLTAHFVFVI